MHCTVIHREREKSMLNKTINYLSGGITNELSALAALARQLQNAGGLQGLSSALTGNMNGNNGPNSGGSTMPMGMKNEPPPSGLGMNQVFSMVTRCR